MPVEITDPAFHSGGGRDFADRRRVRVGNRRSCASLWRLRLAHLPKAGGRCFRRFHR